MNNDSLYNFNNKSDDSESLKFVVLDINNMSCIFRII